MSIAIAISSYALGLINRFIGQAITAILMVYLQSYLWMAKLVGAFKDLSPKRGIISAGLMVLILPAMALSIALSSKALSMVEPISFAQFLTSLGISILFVALSFSVKLILEALKG
jgi:uncharacterized membrane protein